MLAKQTQKLQTDWGAVHSSAVSKNMYKAEVIAQPRSMAAIPVEQQLDGLCLTIASSVMQWGVVIAVLGVNISSSLDKLLGAGNLPIATGKVEGGAPLIILVILVSAALQQLLQSLHISFKSQT